MMSEPSGSSSVESLSRFDDRLRRISTALFGTGMLMVLLLVANSGLVRPHLMKRTALNWLVAAAGVSVVAILLFHGVGMIATSSWWSFWMACA